MKTCKCILLLSAAVAILLVAFAVRDALDRIPTIINSQADRIRNAAVETINTRMDGIQDLARDELRNTRALVSDEMAKTRGMISREMSFTRRDLAAGVDALGIKAQESIQSTAATLDHRLEAVQSDLNIQIFGISDQVRETLDSVNSISRQVDEALPDFLQCYDPETGQGNPNCLLNWWAGIRQDSERALQNGAETSANVAKITDDVHQFLKPRKKRWYEKITDPLKLAIYGAANFLK
jgi:hypothetical protein